jgi:HlyD family secretion protein
VSAAQKELDTAVQDRHVAGHELEQARAAAAQIRLPQAGTAAGASGFAVQAPVAARVLHVLQPSEAVVAQGTPLLELGDTSRMEIVAELLTTDAVAVKPGMRVLIERWGGPMTLQGRIRGTEPAAFTKVSALGVEEQRVNVLIDITSPPEQWRELGDGFRVGVRIVSLEVAQALRVPTSAVFPMAGAQQLGAMAVFVLDGGRAKLTPIVVGARNGTDAWVKSGLNPGAQVIVYPPATVREGSRVKARKV